MGGDRLLQRERMTIPASDPPPIMHHTPHSRSERALCHPRTPFRNSCRGRIPTICALQYEKPFEGTPHNSTSLLRRVSETFPGTLGSFRARGFAFHASLASQQRQPLRDKAASGLDDIGQPSGFEFHPSAACKYPFTSTHTWSGDLI